MSTGGVTDLLSSLVDGVDAASMPLVVSNQDLLDAIGRSEESLTLHAAPDVTDIVGGGVSAQVWSLVHFLVIPYFQAFFFRGPYNSFFAFRNCRKTPSDVPMFRLKNLSAKL